MACCLSRITASAILLALVMPGVRSAWGQQDPANCFSSDVDFSLTVLRADGVTPVADSIASECEIVQYRVTLAKGAKAGACAFGGGQVSLTTPDGVVHVLAASVPCIGGTGANGSGCNAAVTAFTSQLVPYAVRPQDVVASSLVTATAQYAGGTLFRQMPPLPNPPVSSVTEFAQLQVYFCDDGNSCTIDSCDPVKASFDGCRNQEIFCEDNNACTAETCDPQTGNCIFTPPIECDDGDSCTTSYCEPAIGQCVVVSVGCDDGDACTQEDCDCVVTARTNCNDHDACTIDSCGSQTGACTNTASPYPNCDKCGNGVVEPQFGEQCDDGMAGDSASCCDRTCHLRPTSYACRPPAGPCDAPEFCSGTTASCPSDMARPSGFACPDDGRPCTLDECDGTSLACQHHPGHAGLVCRAAAGPCDEDETCDGLSFTCPQDARQPRGTACQSDGNPCTDDICDGYNTACQHISVPAATVVCRSATGECDIAEYCKKGACPTDVTRPTDSPCAADQNPCTRDLCGPAGSCLHIAEQTGTPCGQNAFCNDSAQCLVVLPSCGNGSPNAGEECDQGPANGTPGSCCDVGCQFRPARFECRPQEDACDVADDCTGTSATCVDAKMPNGSQCPSDDDPCTGDTCTNGACTHTQKAVGAPCGGTGNVCNAQGACVQPGTCGNGIPGELSEIDGVFSVEECDLGSANSDVEGAESCCSTTCRLQPTSFICRRSVTTPCTPDTTCRTGAATCPASQNDDNVLCRREECVINSACKDGQCVGGLLVCAVDVRREKVERLVPRTQVQCTAENDATPSSKRARCGFEVTRQLGAGLSDFGRSLIGTGSSGALARARRDGSVTRKCRTAGTGVASACGTAIDRDVLTCAKKNFLLGTYRACKPNACGRALLRLGNKCPQAVDVDTGTLRDQVVATISGLQVQGQDVGDQDVTRTCVGDDVDCQ